MSTLTIGRDVRLRIAALLCLASLVILAYWTAWLLNRSLVATSTSVPYTWFENSFPAADGFLVVCLVLAAWTLVTQRPTALLWLLLGAGGGLYLFFMDVMYDLQHGVWGSGANGVIELMINAVTLAISVGLARWSWRRRMTLLASPPAPGS